MTTQPISGERRKHSREGIIGDLENIAYTVLRKHGIAAAATRYAVMSGTPQESPVATNDFHAQRTEQIAFYRGAAHGTMNLIEEHL